MIQKQVVQANYFLVGKKWSKSGKQVPAKAPKIRIIELLMGTWPGNNLFLTFLFDTKIIKHKLFALLTYTNVEVDTRDEKARKDNGQLRRRDQRTCSAK